MARCPFAEWRGPIPNRVAGGMVPHPHGLVPHVIIGSLASADSAFHNGNTAQRGGRRSAHFGVGKTGRLVQWVDTADRAWAEAAGNALWWSAECEGLDTEPHTDAQIETLARLMVWLLTVSPFTLQVTDDVVNGQGITSHRCGGAAWGAHSCPGDQRHAQRALIVARAAALTTPAATPHTVTIPGEGTDMAMIVVDRKAPASKGLVPNWEANSDGDLFAWNGARVLKPLSAFAAKHPPIVAIAETDDGDGVTLFGDDTRQDPDGSWVRSTYTITVHD